MCEEVIHMSEFKKYEDQLNDCPICGSRPTIYIGAASEPYGRCIQTTTIECSDTTGQHCINELHCITDTDHIHGQLSSLMKVWNELSVK